MHKYIFLVFLYILNTFSWNYVHATDLESSELRQRRLMSLVDYIRGDYSQAVQGGAVKNEMEFAEMKEFASTLIELGQSELATHKELLEKFQSLKEGIESKSSTSFIQALTEQIRGELLFVLDLARAPTHKLNLVRGEQLYSQLCASCHGDTGHGDGPASPGLEPPPRNFHNTEAMETASPLKFFNIQTTGLEGTSMVSYKDVLSAEQRWDIAFYLLGLRHQKIEGHTVFTEEQWKVLRKAGLDLEFLASQTDLDLTKWLEQKVELTGGVQLSHLRVQEFIGAQGREKMSLNLQKLLLTLEKATNLAHKKEYAAVKSLLTDGYLSFFEPLEAFLRVEDPQKTQGIEQAFMSARAFAARKSSDVFIPLKTAEIFIKDLQVDVDTAVLSRPKQEFASGFLIILREGFEAFLVVASLLAMAKNLSSARARWMVHGGWILAVLSGGVVWYGMEFVWSVSGGQRELMEALFTALAVCMLLYTGFWLLSQSDHKNWGQYVKSESRQALQSGKYWGIGFLSFVAVFREAAETILFYQALSHKAATPFWMMSGFFVGVTCLGLISWLILRLNMKLPLHIFFRVTSALMVVLAVVLAGQSAYEFMAAGYLTPTPLPMVPTMTALGVYPSLETLGVQVFLLCLGGGGTFWILRQKKFKSEPKIVSL
ncbi:MAG: FTR1 family protein [Oligoflexales bacterium]